MILAYLGLGSLSSWLPVLLVLLGLRSLESSSLESSLKASAALKNQRSGHCIDSIYVGLLRALEERSVSSKTLQERPRRKLLEGTKEILPNEFFYQKVNRKKNSLVARPEQPVSVAVTVLVVALDVKAHRELL